MRSLLLVVSAVAALVATGWYVVEWMPSDAAAAVSLAPARTGEVRPQEIRSLRLAGDRLPLTILAAKLSSKVGDSLDAATLATDRAALRDALVARGHWAADVGEPETVFGADGGAHVSFAIDPGEVFHLRAVTITGADASVRQALTLTAGDDVTPQRLARNAELLAAYLERQGISGAQVTVETTTDRDARAVDVTFVLQLPARRGR